MTPVDCLTDLFAYTYHLADQLQVQDKDCSEVEAGYTRLIQKARDDAKAWGIPRKTFDHALFPVVAWIDETILATEWNSRNNWVNSVLQKKYFNTTNAGDIFFTRLEKLTADDRDILEAFDYCLASGFKGRFFQSFHSQELEGIRKNTQTLLWGEGLPQMPRVLFPKAGDTSFSKRLKRKRWKGLSGFASIFLLAPVLLYLVLYTFFDRQLNQILGHIGL